MALRVLVLVKGLGIGGAERLIATGVALRDRTEFDYEVAYVMSAHNGLADSVRACDVPVHDLGCRANWDLAWLLRLRRLLVEGDFDVLHMHLPYAASWARLVAATLPRQRRPKLVYTQHWDWRQVRFPVRLLSRMTIGMDDAILAVSDSTLQTMPRSVQRRTEVVVHGIDMAAVAEARSEAAPVRTRLGVPPGASLVLSLANLRPEKAQDVLLEATRILLDRKVPVKVALAGAGPMEGPLREHHRRLGLGDAFVFLGARDDALELLAVADLFVLSSRAEGLPVSVMEALAIGTPVVATAVGGIPDVIEDGVNGRLVPSGRADLLADAIAELVADESARWRLAQAAEATGGRFDARAATRRVESTYLELAAR